MNYTIMLEPLTPANARALPRGRMLRDAKCPGLELWHKPSGRIWLLYYRTRSGQRRRPKLGEFPAVGVDAARERARDLLERVARGEDPSADWQAARAAPTVAELVDRFRADHYPRRPQRYRDDAEGYFRMLAASPLWRVPVADVTYEQIETFLGDVVRRRYASPNHDPRRRTAPTAGNRARSLLMKMFSLAETRYRMRPQGQHPVKGTPRSPEAKRRRHATGAELRGLGEALAAQRVAYPYQVAAIYVMLFCGGRVNEILKARHDQRRGNKLVLEKHKTAGRIGTKVIELPAPAVDMIEALPPHPSGLIFGGGAIRHVWYRVRAQAGCGDLQLRDLRRTYATVAKSSGHTLEAIGEIFGHTDAATTRRYAWLFDDRKVEVSETVAGELARRLGGDQP